jgi:hypothetical protein
MSTNLATGTQVEGNEEEGAATEEILQWLFCVKAPSRHSIEPVIDTVPRALEG